MSDLSAEEARDEAIRRVWAGAPEEWLLTASTLVRAFARAGNEFTTDDLWEVLPHPPEPRAMGAVIAHYARAGTIVQVGYMKGTRPEAHARPIPIWKGTGV